MATFRGVFFQFKDNFSHFDRFSFFPATKLIRSSTETDFHFRRRFGWLFFSFTAGTSFSLVDNLSVVGVTSIGISIAKAMVSKSVVSTIEKIRISISLGFGISRSLAIVSIGISVVSKSIVSTIEKVRISISLRFGISRPLAIVSIGISVVSISKSMVSKSIVSSVQEVGVGISLRLSIS